MPKFTCISSATGEVLYSGDADDLSVLGSVGTSILPGLPPENSYWYQDSWIEIPSQPSNWHEWNWSTRTWVDPRTLGIHKALKIAELRKARENLIVAGFTWDGSTFDSDMVSQTRLLMLQVKALNTPTMVEYWRLQDNSWRPLSAADALEVCAAFEQHLRQAFITFSQKESEVLASSTPEEVSAVFWT